MLFKLNTIKSLIIISLVSLLACSENEYTNDTLTMNSYASGYKYASQPETAGMWWCWIYNDDKYLSDGTRNAYMEEGASIEDYMAHEENIYVMDPNFPIGVKLIKFEPSSLMSEGGWTMEEDHFEVRFIQNPTIKTAKHGDSMGVLSFQRPDGSVYRFNLLL